METPSGAGVAPRGGGLRSQPRVGDPGGCGDCGPWETASGPSANREGFGALVGMAYHSVSTKSLRWQLALTLIPDWGRVGSHVELIAQLRVQVVSQRPQAVSQRLQAAGPAELGWLRVKEVFGPVMFL